MGSRKSELPPNYSFLDLETRLEVVEICSRVALRCSHGHSPNSPLLKSRKKIYLKGGD